MLLFNVKKKEWNLLITSPTKDRIIKAINQFYYSTTFYLTEKNEKEFNVHNSKGIVQDTRVIKKGNRYRFEMYF